MTDEFLGEVQKAWLAKDAEVERVRLRMRRARWAPHIMLVSELVGACVAIAGGLWFALMALNTRSVLYAVSAVTLIALPPFFVWLSIKLRRKGLAWEDTTPEAVLHTGVRRAEASRAAIRLGWWSISAMALFLVALWALQAAGAVSAVDFLIFYTTVCALACAAMAIWLTWRTKQVRQEHAACLRLLREYETTADPAAKA